MTAPMASSSRPPTSDPTRTVDPAQWLDAYGDCLFAYALRKVEREDVAEDLVQETLLTALRKRDSFEGRSSQRTWLIGILRNLILQYFHKQKPATLAVDMISEAVVESQFTRMKKWARKPHDWDVQADLSDAELDELRDAIRQCMSKLPDKVADAFYLAEQQDCGSDVVSESIGVTPNHLYVLLYRARTALRKCLEINWHKVRSGASKGDGGT
jgi:RNA polymerase sigma-70 factor (TIGR02943 family)